MEAKPVTILDLQAKKREGVPITMLTAYDYPTALVVDRSGIDVILVGDSLAMVVLGYETTLPVTMEEMLHHCRAVKRGAKRALLVGDMPFLSYQGSVEQAVINAGRFLKGGGMAAAKLEGGREMVPQIRGIVQAGIPVMGHLGLTPQSIHQFGGYKVQGKSAAAAQRLIEDAGILEEAGCFSIVLEAIPAPVAEEITKRVSIPTIGIGAGPGCDGQVLVLHDLLGMFDRFIPKFVKKYADLFAEMTRAVEAYRDEVRARKFPGPEHSYTIPAEEWAAIKR